MNDAQVAQWEAAGARAADTIRADVGALVVLGKDAEATAHAALGLARALARTRQVALADLLGESRVLAGLVHDPAAPGIADSFVHGVSLNRVAQPVPGIERLFILPSGGIEASAPDVLASTRWNRLARGFREVDAQLIVVAHAGEPEAEGLARRLGGAVVVGTDVVLGPDVPTVATLLPLPLQPSAGTMRPAPVGSVVAERTGAPLHAGTPGDADAPDVTGSHRLTPALTFVLPSEGRLAAGAPPRGRLLALLGLLALAASGAAAVYAPTLLRGRSVTADALASAPATSAVASPMPVDTVTLDTAGLAPANPGDSTRAASFAVELLAANTLNGAVLTLGDSLPAGTVAPALLGPSRSRWFRVVAGAYGTRREADSLLAELVRRRRATEGAARVIQAPLAFRLEAAVSPDSTPLALARWKRSGIPAYALVQDGGKVTIFAGAFERLDQAALLRPALRALGAEPDLAYRTGRTF